MYREKIERLAEETRALVDDLADWVELKITLTRLEIEEQLNEALNRMASQAIAGIIALFGVGFLSMALALALGSLLGHAAWGFLIVGLVYATIARVLSIRPISMFHISLEKKPQNQSQSSKSQIQEEVKRNGAENFAVGGDKSPASAQTTGYPGAHNSPGE